MMGMMLAVVFHGMAAAHDFAAQIRVTLGFLADAEKGRLGSISIEYVEYLRGDEGIWTVIDGQGNFISGRGGSRQPCPVRPQPVAARPQADGGNQQVIGDHGAQHPTPLPRFSDDCHQGHYMQSYGCADEQRRPPACTRHWIFWRKSSHRSAPG